jgi:hypothetical protein
MSNYKEIYKMKIKNYLVLASGRTKVHHNAKCICMKYHGPYKAVTANEAQGLRACGYCGGGGQ